jgi:hypothetical protein
LYLFELNQIQPAPEPMPTVKPSPSNWVIWISNMTTYFRNTTFTINPNNYSIPLYVAELPITENHASNTTMSERDYFLAPSSFIPKSTALLYLHIKTYPLSDFYIYKSETFYQKVEGETTIYFTDLLAYELHFGNPTNQTVTFALTISATQTLVSSFWEAR